MVDDGRTDDGRTPDHGHPISSPCEPNGSGELKIIKILSVCGERNEHKALITYVWEANPGTVWLG